MADALAGVDWRGRLSLAEPLGRCPAGAPLAVTRARIGRPAVSLSLAADRLEAIVVLPDVEVGLAPAGAASAERPLVRSTARALTLVLEVRAKADPLGAVRVRGALTGLSRADATLAPADASSEAARDTLEAALAAIVGDEVGRALQGALASLLEPTPRALRSGAIVSRALFARDIALDPSGITIPIATAVVVPPGPSAPLVPAAGGLRLPSGAPSARIDPDAARDVTLALAPEAISQALHEGWRAGTFHVTLDGALLAPLHPLGPDAAGRLRALLPGPAQAVPEGSRIELRVAPERAPTASISTGPVDGSVVVEVSLSGLSLEVRATPPGAPEARTVLAARFAARLPAALVPRGDLVRLAPDAASTALSTESVDASAGPVTSEEAAALARLVLPRLFAEATSEVEALRLPTFAPGGAPRPSVVRAIRLGGPADRPSILILGGAQ